MVFGYLLQFQIISISLKYALCGTVSKECLNRGITIVH